MEPPKGAQQMLEELNYMGSHTGEKREGAKGGAPVIVNPTRVPTAWGGAHFLSTSWVSLCVT